MTTFPRQPDPGGQSNFDMVSTDTKKLAFPPVSPSTEILQIGLTSAGQPANEPEVASPSQDMNAYQLPFNAGSSASPFNYFPQNSHSYGVISPSYGNPRSAGISQTHKNMSSQAPFVSPSNYFHPHQSHLQPFTSFASPVQSASGAIPYTHNQYNAYTGASSPNLASSSSAGNFDYSHGYNSANLSTSSTYSYISNCSSSYSPYSQSTAHVSSPSNTIPSATSSSYQSSNPTESYLNLCTIKNEPGEDSYTLNLHKGDSQMPPATKKAKKSGRGRGRRNLNPSPSPDNIIDRIFVWYIDETVLVYLTMAEYSHRANFNDPILVNQPLFSELNMFISKFADKYLFLDDLNDIDQSHIDDSTADDNGQDLNNYDFRADGFKSSVTCNLGSTRNSAELRQKMALRYRKINELYGSYGDKLSEMLDKSEYDQMVSLMRRFDLNTKNWVHSATKALNFIKQRPNCLNVLISSSPLIKTLSKVMLFGLSSYFSVNNIYSCSKTSKEYTLNRVLNRFGSNCTYIVVGKAPEEQQLSQKMELPFWPVTEKEHFESLLNAMHYYF